MKKLILILTLSLPFSAIGNASERIEADVVVFSQNIAPLTTVKINGQLVLTNSSGLTVYTYDPDQQGTSNCYGGCASVWPPVLVPSGASVNPPLGLTTRQDGSHQVTYNSHPVYTYVGDQTSEQTNGNGLGGVWHIVIVPN